MPKRVSIIGCGAIGTELAKAIDSQTIPNVILLSVVDIDAHAVEKLSSPLHHSSSIKKFLDLNSFYDSKEFLNSDIIIEAASPNALKNMSKSILRTQKDFLLMSVGAFSDIDFFSTVFDIIKSFDCRIHIPSGAIAGIDAIKSVKSQLSSVTLTTTKNREGLRNAPYFTYRSMSIDDIKDKVLLFTGSARDAIANFPNNVNVASILSLVGLGFENTVINIYLDPFISTNKHEIIAKGSFGTIYCLVENIPSPMNPKTSYLAILSAIECLKNIVDTNIHIGT